MHKLYFDYVELISLNFYKIVFKPFICDDYFANSIASFIRQSLFTNIAGYAVTEIKIFGANNEYGNVSGLKEDVLNLILNIKGLIFKLKKRKVFLKLSSSKEIVKGKHIILNKKAKLINPEHVICHLNKGEKINIIFKIEKGKGYVPFNSDKDFRYSSNLKNGILIDSNFCPIIRASYSIHKISDTLYNNLKKIFFFIETNGTINAKKAIINSINSFLSSFSNFSFLKKNNDNFIFYNDYKNILHTTILDLGFSFKIIKMLNSVNIFRLSDLIKCSKKDFLNIFNFSKKTFKEIKKVLKFHEISLSS